MTHFDAWSLGMIDSEKNERVHEGGSQTDSKWIIKKVWCFNGGDKRKRFGIIGRVFTKKLDRKYVSISSKNWALHFEWLYRSPRRRLAGGRQRKSKAMLEINGWSSILKRNDFSFIPQSPGIHLFIRWVTWIFQSVLFVVIRLMKPWRRDFEFSVVYWCGRSSSQLVILSAKFWLSKTPRACK